MRLETDLGISIDIGIDMELRARTPLLRHPLDATHLLQRRVRAPYHAHLAQLRHRDSAHSPEHAFALNDLAKKMDTLPLCWTNYTVPTETARHVWFDSIETGGRVRVLRARHARRGCRAGGLVLAVLRGAWWRETGWDSAGYGVAGAAVLCDLIASAYLTAAGEERGCGFE